MKPRKFLEQLRHDEIVAAIREAEKKTSGEIRVFISQKTIEDPVLAAQSHFVRMGMEKTRDRNAVLIFVAPRSHNFAIIGDTGVHSRCGDPFWNELATEMSGHFKDGLFTSGLLHAIQKAGDHLGQHFPHRPDDENELPDQVETD
jgi:uncharacterized membrane protein